MKTLLSILDLNDPKLKLRVVLTILNLTRAFEWSTRDQIRSNAKPESIVTPLSAYSASIGSELNALESLIDGTDGMKTPHSEDKDFKGLQRHRILFDEDSYPSLSYVLKLFINSLLIRVPG